MIQAGHISKYYGDHKVLADLNFSVSEGEILGIMGANGAGKSTLFNILASLDNDFEGDIRICGMELIKNKRLIREEIGYVPGQFSLYNDLTVTENLSFFASAYGCDANEIRHICPVLWQSLEPFSRFEVRFLSGGMKQKLAFLCALVHTPRLVLLDEPTTGIDPLSRHVLWQELKSLQNRGTTILISTHYLEEAGIADRILFLHEGRQLLLDLPENILADYGNKLFALSGSPVQQLYRIFNFMPYSKGCYIRGEKLFLALPDYFTSEMVRGFSLEQGLKQIKVKNVMPDIEDSFIHHLVKYKEEMQ
jgi:ABC-type multidrug transport system ATPase subunit